MHRSVRALLLGTVACGVGFAVVAAAAYGSSWGGWLDGSALDGFLHAQGPVVRELTQSVVQLGNPLQVAFIGCGIAAVAAARGRPRVALAILALVAATSVSSQVLKELLAHPRDGASSPLAHVAAKALPSGHSTAAMALALAAVFAAPRRARVAAAAIGAAFALAMGFSVVSLGWHFPSDVLAGFLLATGWAFAIAAGLRWSQQHLPERRDRRLGFTKVVEQVSASGLTAAAIGVALTVALTTLVLLGTHTDQLVQYGRDHTAAVGVLMGMTAAALALPAAMVAALRRH